MSRRNSIEFVEASRPIRELVTKFGGQPVWLHEPKWPKSRQTGELMRFIGQVAIHSDLDAPISIEPRMAYLFMTDGDDYVDGTWEADGGENAVVIQPGTVQVPTEPVSEGPTLYRMVKRPGHDRLVPEECEFGVHLSCSEDPDFVPEDDRLEWEKSQFPIYFNALVGNKIGGTPGFLQGDEFPGDNFSRLLLQLDSATVPFSVNFGDAGIGYAFLSEDSSSAKFLWQCC